MKIIFYVISMDFDIDVKANKWDIEWIDRWHLAHKWMTLLEMHTIIFLCNGYRYLWTDIKL